MMVVCTYIHAIFQIDRVRFENIPLYEVSHVGWHVAQVEQQEVLKGVHQ